MPMQALPSLSKSEPLRSGSWLLVTCFIFEGDSHVLLGCELPNEKSRCQAEVIGVRSEGDALIQNLLGVRCIF